MYYVGLVVKGLDIGVSTMTSGEICKLTCKSNHAFGKKGLPPSVPSDSTVVFEVELLHWRGMWFL